MTFGQFLSIVRARKWLALFIFLTVLGVSVALSLLLPKQYRAETTVVIDNKPDPVSALAMPTMTSSAFIATQVDIMTSDRVALRVIRDLKLVDSPAIRAQWLESGQTIGTIEQFLVDLLQKGLEVKPSRESNVVALAYTSPDPNFSAGLVNAYAAAYIQTTLELRSDPARNFRRFFDAQTKESRDALEKAQIKLSSFQREKGIIVSGERLDVENARLNELSSQLTQLQAISAESGSRQVQAQGGQADRMQEVLNNPLIGGLKADLTRNEARLQELNQRLGDSHPQVQEARASITELRAKIDAETRRVTGGVAVSNTINKAREGQLRASLEAQRAKILQMKAMGDEGQVLQREVENAQRVYDNLMVRLSQIGLEAQNTQSYANVLTTATPPSEPSSPRVVRNILLGLAGGVWLALLVVFIRELLDRRVRRPVDVAASIGLPMLGVLPKPGAKRFQSGNQALLLQQRVIGLPAPRAHKGH